MVDLRPTWLKLKPIWVKEKDSLQQLVDLQSELVHLPVPSHEILLLLDQLGCLLMKISQTPPSELKEVLSSYVDVLIREELFKHPDVDVKIAVILCICELARISAPKLPFNDDQMKRISKHVVFSLGGLSVPTSRSYSKAIDILSIIAKSNLVVLMLDLDCGDLIIVMFHLFLTTISSDHPQTVVEDMESIMSTLLEESDEILMELVSPIMACIDENTPGVAKTAQELARKVLDNCSRLTPYLRQTKLAPPATTQGVKLTEVICRQEQYSILLYRSSHDDTSNTEQRRNLICNDIIQGDAKVEATLQIKKEASKDDKSCSKQFKYVAKRFQIDDDVWKYLVYWTDHPSHSYCGERLEHRWYSKNRLKVFGDFLQYLVHRKNRPKFVLQDGLWKYLVHWMSRPKLSSQTLRSRVISSGGE